MASISLRNLVKNYGEVLAVDSISFTIKDKEFFALLGPSGCGKSSTLRMVAGLEDITGGEIYFDDVCINDIATRDRDIAMAFENYALYPYWSVYKNIAYPLKIRNVPKSKIDVMVKEVAQYIDLLDILNQNVKSLSGGQQQRTGVARALARALLKNPSAFLLDEPISHLEAELKTSMRNELRNVCTKIGTTIIYVTHDQEEAMSMADRIAVMKLGKVLQVGTPDEVYYKPTNEFVAGFIGEPAMNLFKGSIERNNGKIYLAFEGQKITLPARFIERVKEYKEEKVRVGIRPHDIDCSGKKLNQGSCIKGKIIFIEPRNENILINTKVGDINILALTENVGSFAINDEIYMRFDEEYMYLFDVNSGESLS
jgi:multiple sugar transport system ATP-binding protein